MRWSAALIALAAGAARPQTIFNGGVPSGLAERIRWGRAAKRVTIPRS